MQISGTHMWQYPKNNAKSASGGSASSSIVCSNQRFSQIREELLYIWKSPFCLPELFLQYIQLQWKCSNIVLFVSRKELYICTINSTSISNICFLPSITTKPLNSQWKCSNGKWQLTPTHTSAWQVTGRMISYTHVATEVRPCIILPKPPRLKVTCDWVVVHLFCIHFIEYYNVYLRHKRIQNKKNFELESFRSFRILQL